MEPKQRLDAIVKQGKRNVYHEKYIIAEVQGEGCVTKVLVSLPLEYHREIAVTYTNRVIKIKGGGFIKINWKTKEIQAYGQSQSYGKPQVKLVKTILQHAFPNYRIDAKATDLVMD